ncbi:peptidyl-prolyl cis-trans isomerase [Flavobacteriaceae bacterium]|nr:peptidyl-prolyl cis-trans isomerase [Flavobacteriaceae bacterium]
MSFFVAFRMKILSLVVFFVFFSCTEWTPEEEEVVARVGDVFLYVSDFQGELGNFQNESDSILKTRNYIDLWAKNQLLVQLATQNLDEEELKELEKLVNQYRFDLYSNNYIQSLVNNALDTLIKTSEIDSFLLANKGVFKLNAPLFQARFIHLPPDNVDQKEIQRSFQRFNLNDRSFLDSLSFQFSNYLIADSIWINKRDLISDVGFLNHENADKYLKKSQFFRVEDSLGVYLLYIDKLIKKGETAPRAILESTIKNIIRNQRKLKFTKQFEKDIIQDAIKSKTYETY